MNETKAPIGSALRVLVRAVNFRIELEDHGLIVLAGEFRESGGQCQGLGRHAQDLDDFLKKFLAVFNVCDLTNVEGKACWITRRHDGIIYRIDPLFPNEGEPLDLDAPMDGALIKFTFEELRGLASWLRTYPTSISPTYDAADKVLRADKANRK